MNKRYLILTMTVIIVFLSICLIFAQQIIQPAGIYVDETRNSDGTMTFTVRTIAYGGTYSPRNVGAIWITNSSNQFVKTIKVWAATYRSRLVKWIASSGNNTTGAITTATLNSHQLHSVSWNGKNYSNATLPDGNYNVNIEYTESNSTISSPGKYKVITFSNSTTPVDITPSSDSYFTDMHLIWTPTPPANGAISGTVTNAQNVNIPGAVITAGTQTATTNSSGFYSMSLQPGTYTVTCSITGYDTQTNNNVVVQSNQTTTSNFSLNVTSIDNQISIQNSIILNQNHPNPFSASTTIRYFLPRKSNVILGIYNTKGQLIKTLSNTDKNAGWHEVMWDGTNNHGLKQSSGNYICRFNAGRVTRTKVITFHR